MTTNRTKIISNPPAFPKLGQVVDFGDGWIPAQEGMSIRDYFASQALTAVLKQVTEYCESRNQWPPEWRDGVASDCYKIADAMLKIREKDYDNHTNC